MLAARFQESTAVGEAIQYFLGEPERRFEVAIAGTRPLQVEAGAQQRGMVVEECENMSASLIVDAE